MKLDIAVSDNDRKFRDRLEFRSYEEAFNIMQENDVNLDLLSPLPPSPDGYLTLHCVPLIGFLADGFRALDGHEHAARNENYWLGNLLRAFAARGFQLFRNPADFEFDPSSSYGVHHIVASANVDVATNLTYAITLGEKEEPSEEHIELMRDLGLTSDILRKSVRLRGAPPNEQRFDIVRNAVTTYERSLSEKPALAAVATRHRGPSRL